MVTFCIYWKLIIHVGLVRVWRVDIIYVMAFFYYYGFFQTLILFWQWVRSHCCWSLLVLDLGYYDHIKSSLFDMVVCPFEVVKDPLVNDRHLISLLRLSLTCTFIYSIISQHPEDVRDCCTILLILAGPLFSLFLSLYILLISS